MHLSLHGVVVPAALLAVGFLSLTGISVGMRYITDSLSSRVAHIDDAMLLPTNLQSSDQVVPPSDDDDDESRASGYREDIIANEEIDDIKASNEIVVNESKITEDAGGRQFFNAKNDDISPASHSYLKQRKTRQYPRIISIDGSRNMPDSNTTRKVEVSRRFSHHQKRLKNSDDWSYRDPLYKGECVPMQKWQETSFPNCNLFHELDYRGKLPTDEFEYYAYGGYNHIFWLNEEDKRYDPEFILKILKYGTDYSDRNFDRVRRDALILERLTKSPYVLDIYGFCGFEVFTAYADGGTISDEIDYWRRGKIELTSKERLKYAVEMSGGLAAVHDIDGEGLSSVAHGDLKGSQYLFLNDTLKLGDFNRGRFLRRNTTAPDTACPYTIGQNDHSFRSPEEYEYIPQTSAIDIWALGSILQYLLTGREVWHGVNFEKAQRLIRKGELPTIPDEYKESKDPVDMALIEAIGMCYVFDPKKRAKAGEVYSFLEKKFTELPGNG